MKNISACLTSKSDEWSTPSDIYKWFCDQGFFDPCPRNHLEDGLTISWCEKTFVNPPYSEIDKWVDKAISESKDGKLIIMLLPSRTDTKWFVKLVKCNAVRIHFIEGRLHFNDSKCAPFPSMYVSFNIIRFNFCFLFMKYSYFFKNMSLSNLFFMKGD